MPNNDTLTIAGMQEDKIPSIGIELWRARGHPRGPRPNGEQFSYDMPPACYSFNAPYLIYPRFSGALVQLQQGWLPHKLTPPWIPQEVPLTGTPAPPASGGTLVDRHCSRGSLPHKQSEDRLGEPRFHRYSPISRAKTPLDTSAKHTCTRDPWELPT